MGEENETKVPISRRCFRDDGSDGTRHTLSAKNGARQTMVPVSHFLSWTVFPREVRRNLMQEFADNGAKHLVLTHTLIEEIMADSGYAETLQKEVADAGLSFVGAHAPFGTSLDLDVPFPRARSMMMQRHRLALEIVSSFGIDSCTIHVGNTPELFRGYSLADLYNNIVDALENLLPVAEQNGVTIAIENIWFPTNTPERLLALIEHFHSKYLGICYDSGHANLMAFDRNFTQCAPRSGYAGWGEVEWDDRILEKLLPEVITCHLHDNSGQWDDHSLPGRGDVNWPHVMGLLKQAPRLTSVQNEVNALAGHVSIASCCRRFDELMKL